MSLRDAPGASLYVESFLTVCTYISAIVTLFCCTVTLRKESGRQAAAYEQLLAVLYSALNGLGAPTIACGQAWSCKMHSEQPNITIGSCICMCACMSIHLYSYIVYEYVVGKRS